MSERLDVGVLGEEEREPRSSEGTVNVSLTRGIPEKESEGVRDGVLAGTGGVPLGFGELANDVLSKDWSSA